MEGACPGPGAGESFSGAEFKREVWTQTQSKCYVATEAGREPRVSQGRQPPEEPEEPRMTLPAAPDLERLAPVAFPVTHGLILPAVGRGQAALTGVSPADKRKQSQFCPGLKDKIQNSDKTLLDLQDYECYLAFYEKYMFPHHHGSCWKRKAVAPQKVWPNVGEGSPVKTQCLP